MIPIVFVVDRFHVIFIIFFDLSFNQLIQCRIKHEKAIIQGIVFWNDNSKRFSIDMEGMFGKEACVSFIGSFGFLKEK